MIEIGFCLSTFGTPYISLRDAAQQIESLGYVSIHVWDHYVAWPDPQASVLEAWTTLAGLAEATQRVRIGPLVANNLNRHPGRLAKVAATLHELSDVRCDLAIGSGSVERSKRRSGSKLGMQRSGLHVWKKRFRLSRLCGKANQSLFTGSFIN